MDLELNDDQQALRASVAEVLSKQCTPAVVRSAIDSDDAATALYATYAALDWPALAIAEAAGGMGYGPVELALMSEQLGYAADPSPLFATAGQFAAAVSLAADPAQATAILTSVAAGDQTGALALGDPRLGRLPIATSTADGWLLTGRVDAVLDGDRADLLAVLAELDGEPTLFVVSATDVERTRVRAFDATLHVASVELDNTLAHGGARLTGSTELVASTAATMLAASMTGTSQRIFEIALAYVKQRKQFGVAVGSFQAVKHKLVDMFVSIERARALTMFAALTLADHDERATRSASMAKAAAGDAQRICAQDGIQLLGGIGYTWEHDMQVFVRRAKAGELLLGGATTHRALVADDLLQPTGT